MFGVVVDYRAFIYSNTIRSQYLQDLAKPLFLTNQTLRVTCANQTRLFPQCLRNIYLSGPLTGYVRQLSFVSKIIRAVTGIQYMYFHKKNDFSFRPRKQLVSAAAADERERLQQFQIRRRLQNSKCSVESNVLKKNTKKQ